MSDRQEKNYYQIIGFHLEYDRLIITMLDGTFKHSDGFKGATGTRLEVLTHQELEGKNDFDEAKEYCRDIWQEAVRIGRTELGLEEWTDEYLEELEENEEYLGVDNSYSNECLAQLQELFGTDLEEFPEDFPEEMRKILLDFGTTDCTGGGRCFDYGVKPEDFDYCVAPELLEVINEFEKPEDTKEEAHEEII